MNVENNINKYGNPQYGGNNLSKRVIIATLFNAEPVLRSVTKLGADRLILLIDTKPVKEQQDSLDLIQKSLGKVIDVKSIKTDVYNIVEIAKKCVEIIDLQPADDIISINITSGRKTKAIGLLFAAYARHERVSKIMYQPEEHSEDIVYLPRLSFKLTLSQKSILETINHTEFDSIADLAKKVDMSQAMLYRALDELKDMDLVSTENGIKLTDAGKIARL